MPYWTKFLARVSMFALAISIAIPGNAQQLTFRDALQLALKHGTAVSSAVADQMKAQSAYQELKNNYKPNLTFGSGVGYSYGYPLSLEGSAPSIFNMNYQSTVYNPAMSQFLKAAKTEWQASAISTADARKDTILETALNYLQLDAITTQLQALEKQHTEAVRLVNITGQRVQQGVDSEVELTRAKLMEARVRMRTVELEGDADVLRTQLSQLTGVPAQSIQTVGDSIPKLPQLDQQQDLISVALDNNNAVKVAEAHAKAQVLKAEGERKALYPSFDLVAQYGLFSNALSNYSSFFRTFQRNNATFGLAIRLPVLNFVQRAKAAEAEADAHKAQAQVRAVRDQVSAQTLKLQRSVQQLSAAQDVAQLEFQLARSDADAIRIRAQNGGTTPVNQPGVQPVPGSVATERDVANADLAVLDKYSQYLDTTFEFEKARLQLLRQTGELENWALPARP